MRQEFRAFADGKMHYCTEERWWYFGGTGYWSLNHGEEPGTVICDSLESENAHLLESTGLRDKHNQDIYEGDIVTGNIMDYEGNHEVIFYDGCFSVKADDNYYPCLCEGCLEDSLEIIGNIHENSELLNA